MKAINVTAYGDINDVVTIVETPKPEVKSGTLLIQVGAASINPLDNLIRAGYMKEMIPMSFPYVMGSDGAGTVVEVGAGVEGFSVGDEVFFRPDFSEAATFANFQRVSVDSVALKPVSLSVLASAALPQVALTAYQALLAGGKIEGSKVLIHGGAGGVGSLAIQLAKVLGAKEIITTAESEFESRLRSYGADTVIDFRSQDFSELVSDVDITIDTIGGQVQEKSIGIAKHGGSVITLVGAMFEELAAEKGVALELLFHHANGQHLKWIAEQVDAGNLSVQIDTTYAISSVYDVYAALSYVEQGKARGKVVLDMSDF
ncbi:NADP-dependent oxidoreductase [Shewanella canadensis]|uniref:NADP-dependent oxidoreductase n=1 Tax=Shewanella canadensis TaxID=271096 RepID=A0A3S0KTE4_9GAMM|nr:NADP-dependent oxidoreductase [Shewanella canadensis]RTR37996.1 NADP-dependent oxidoreductase [Shewanella canadensis]